MILLSVVILYALSLLWMEATLETKKSKVVNEDTNIFDHILYRYVLYYSSSTVVVL